MTATPIPCSGRCWRPTSSWWSLTILAASLAAGLDLSVQGQRWEFLVLAMAMVLTLCVNMVMLKRRFRPLERLIDRIERVDPAEPAAFEPGHEPFEEIDRLAQSFRGLLGRHRGRAPPLGPPGAARPGGGAPPRGPRPPRRGQPGAHGHPAAAGGAGLRLTARAGARGGRAQAAGQPGHGGADRPGPPAAARRAGRPRPGVGDRGPAQAVRRAQRGADEHDRPRRRRRRWTTTARPRSTGSPRRR